MIRVVIVDDHRFVRTAARAVLHAQGMLVVGECWNGAEALAAAATLLPDVVLMDVRMPFMSGIVATGELTARRPQIRVLMFAGCWDAAIVDRARRVGARGFILKGDPTTLIAAVRIVAGGGRVWSSWEANTARAFTSQYPPGNGAESVDQNQSELRVGRRHTTRGG